MGWFVGSSTRTPSSCISIMAVSALYEGRQSERNLPRRREEGYECVRIRLERRRIGNLQDVGKVPVALLEVETVADHEPVRAIEADVGGAERDDPADRAVQEGADFQRGRAARA